MAAARRASALAALSLAACSHLGQSVIATLPTVGPRPKAFESEAPLRVGPHSALCLEAPEGGVVAPAAAAFQRDGGAVQVSATLAREDGEERLDLPRPFERKLGGVTFLCLAATGAAPPGLTFDRAILQASTPVLLPQIVWFEGPRK